MHRYKDESEACAMVMALLRNCPHEDSMRVLEWRAGGMSWVAIMGDLCRRLSDLSPW